ncbi:hypothetical protein K1X09_15270 [Paenibacillus lautus]|nr:hypothetical protein [Paenibacillus lautus]
MLPDPIRLPNGIRFLKEGQKVEFNLFEFQSIVDSQRRNRKWRRPGWSTKNI